MPRYILSSFEREYLEERASSNVLVDDFTAVMPPSELERLRTYSSTLPTGAYIGKRWKREITDAKGNFIKWMMGEYAPNPDNKLVDIIWRDIEVIDDVKVPA